MRMGPAATRVILPGRETESPPPLSVLPRTLAVCKADSAVPSPSEEASRLKRGQEIRAAAEAAGPVGRGTGMLGDSKGTDRIFIKMSWV